MSILVGECRALLASGSEHTLTVSARAILGIYNFYLGTTKIGKRHSLGQAPKSTANGSLARCASRVKLGSNVSDQKKCVIETLDDVQ